MNPRARSVLRVAVLLVLSTAVIALGFAGCGGDKGTDPTMGTGTVSGLVQNVNGNAAIAGATVTASSGATATTDAQGRFSVSVAAGQRVRLDVTKATFSLNQIVVQLAAGESKSFAVGLMAAGTTSSLDVAAGGLVTDAASNATLSLPADFVTASGSVNVTVTGLDPTTDQIKALPGGLDAVDANGQSVYLTPVSFAEYTVKDGSGKVLQFNPSASQGADIELPIPASLQGQSGYQNGDPIECYVYDPADGKWKTPVPGVIGPSSVDGQPAIKATIFHLSWYGGAPASNDVGCVEGTVTVNGSPAANVDVEAFPGGSTRTNAQGFYRVQAALNSNVRVVASEASGTTTFRMAEGQTTVGSAPEPCATLNLVLGEELEGEVNVEAFITSSSFGGTPMDLAYASLYTLVGNNPIPLTTAVVEIRTGDTRDTLAHSGNGFYVASTGTGEFALQPGHTYTISIDVNHDGTFDGSGQVDMVGRPVITSPAAKSTVPSVFTATWTDPGTAVVGYSATYFGSVSPVGEVDTAAANVFLTTSRSKVIGDGTVDPIYLLPNPPLEPGDYEFEILAVNGPYWYFLGDPSDFEPNITGTNITGYFSTIGIGEMVPFSSSPPTGASAARPALPSHPELRRLKLPPGMEQAMRKAQGRWRGSRQTAVRH